MMVLASGTLCVLAALMVAWHADGDGIGTSRRDGYVAKQPRHQ